MMLSFGPCRLHDLARLKKNGLRVSVLKRMGESTGGQGIPGFLFPQFSLYSPLTLQVSEVGRRLTGCKPLLGEWKILPHVTIDIPAHLRGHLIGALPPLFQNAKDLLRPYFMVFLQLGDPLPVMMKKVAMPGQHQVDVILIYFIETLQVQFQGIMVLRPQINIGSYVPQDMVPGEEDLCLRIIKTHMAFRVPGSLHAAEGVVSNGKHIPFPQKA
jgi:hypothetical protein